MMYTITVADTRKFSRLTMTILERYLAQHDQDINGTIEITAPVRPPQTGGGVRRCLTRDDGSRCLDPKTQEPAEEKVAVEFRALPTRVVREMERIHA